MKIKILNIRKSPKGYPIGYGQVGDKYGEVWLSPEIVEPGEYALKTRLVVKEGRFTVQLRAEIC
ncbi:hypothetical protein [Azonexus sp.]|jgi:hypothetical protein|uniref:hypothetical protein n=1 Tax=Azonexus sp. TaxID=1872668 RepID=UPI0028230172|nr:hypothetical protein [Azonexus sp.]MDR1996476.1 hypothetical protein [Azonexus sp.]